MSFGGKDHLDNHHAPLPTPEKNHMGHFSVPPSLYSRLSSSKASDLTTNLLPTPNDISQPSVLHPVLTSTPDKLPPRESIGQSTHEIGSKTTLALQEKFAATIETKDRHHAQVENFLEVVHPFIAQGVLPDIDVNAYFQQPFPAAFAKYMQVLLYTLITHPLIRKRRKVVLTPAQRVGFEQAYEQLIQSADPEFIGNFENWITQSHHLLYQNPKRGAGRSLPYRPYLDHWKGKMCQDGPCSHRAISFLKEYITADLLNSFTTARRKIASDFDDKQLGFDLVCIDHNEAELGIVDMTFTRDKRILKRKLAHLEQFLKENWFQNSDFKAHFFEGVLMPHIEPNGAILKINRYYYMQALVSYLHLISKGGYNGALSLQKNLIPIYREWLPTKESKKNNFFSAIEGKATFQKKPTQFHEEE